MQLRFTMSTNSSDNIAHTVRAAAGCDLEPNAPANALYTDYDSPKEAVGAMVRELLACGKRVSFEEIQLMLIVRLKMTVDLSQEAILKGALTLLQTAGQP